MSLFFLSEDKSKVIGYPDIRDVYYKGELAYPTRLHQGYLLDNRGINQNSAFLNITYKKYSQLSETPSSIELFSMILDNNPFTELYNCGNRYQFTNEVEELNEIIDNNELNAVCKKLQ